MAVTRLAVASAEIPIPFMATYEAWTPLAEYNHVEDISDVMERKLQAIQCYPSQLTGFRYDRAIRGLNEYRGALAAKCDYAEVFQCFEGSQ
jgi:LmbE family N-acetylglucosaminyl deacetylase